MSGILERAVDALERIATALEAGRTNPEAASETPEPEPAETKKPAAKKPAAKKEATVTKEDVREALKALQKATDANVARGVLGVFDVQSISALEESQYGEVVAAANAALPA